MLMAVSMTTTMKVTIFSYIAYVNFKTDGVHINTFVLLIVISISRC